MIKLGTNNVSKIYLGSTEVQKMYLGSTLLYDNTIEGFSGTDSNLFSSYSYIDLPDDKWIESPAHVYNQNSTSGEGLLPYEMLGDGVVLHKYVTDYAYISDMSLKNIPTGEVKDFWIEGTIQVYSHSNGGFDTGVAPVEGTYYGLQRVGTSIKVVSTTDGVSFTTIYDFGTSTGFTRLTTWYDNYGPLYYPQGQGITSI